VTAPESEPAEEPVPEEPVVQPETEPETEMDTTSQAEVPNGPTIPYWIAIGFMGAGIASTGLGWGLYGYYSNSENNYADKISGQDVDNPSINWDDYSWEVTCNSGQVDPDTGTVPVEGGSIGIYFCSTERTRRDFEKKAKTSLIPAIAGSAVAAASLTLAIIFYTHPEWFSSSNERAKIYLSPVATSTFSGLSLVGNF
jgi:hypothetical protein